MDPGGRKSIFGQKTKSSIFRPKLAPKCSLEAPNRFLVKKLKIQIFDRKWTLWVKNRKFNFSTKINPKMVPTDVKSLFGRKMRNSNFRPKIYPGVQKSKIGKKMVPKALKSIFS